MGSAGSILHRSRGREAKSCNVLRGHEGSINAMCLSENGLHLCSGSEDGTARVWETETRELHAEMTGHSQYINCIAMGEDCVVTGSADKAIRKWDLHSGRCLSIFTGHQSVINGLLVHENLLFSTSFDKTARQWSMMTGESLHVYTGHTRGVTPLLCITLEQPDSRSNHRRKSHSNRRLSTSSILSLHKTLLITGSADNTAKAWALDSSASVMTYRGHGSGVVCLCSRQDYRELYTGSSDGTVRLWNIDSGELRRVFDGHQGAIVGMKVCI